MITEKLIIEVDDYNRTIRLRPIPSESDDDHLDITPQELRAIVIEASKNPFMKAVLQGEIE